MSLEDGNEMKRNSSEFNARVFAASDEAGHDHSGSSPNRLLNWVSAAVMTGTGLLFVALLVSGNIQNYINTQFIIYTYIGAAILLLLGFHGMAVASGRIGQVYHAHLGFVAAAVFAVPLIFGLIVPSRPLGLQAVSDDIDAADVVARVDASNTAITATDTWTILDWLSAYYSADDFTLFEGQPADVVGFVRTVPEDGDGFFRVNRFMITCCTADTLSVGMPVQHDGNSSGAVQLNEGGWVRVTGEASVGEFSGDTQPFIKASRIQPLDQAPEPSYLYP